MDTKLKATLLGRLSEAAQVALVVRSNILWAQSTLLQNGYVEAAKIIQERCLSKVEELYNVSSTVDLDSDPASRLLRDEIDILREIYQMIEDAGDVPPGSP